MFTINRVLNAINATAARNAENETKHLTVNMFTAEVDDSYKNRTYATAKTPAFERDGVRLGYIETVTTYRGERWSVEGWAVLNAPRYKAPKSGTAQVEFQIDTAYNLDRRARYSSIYADKGLTDRQREHMSRALSMAAGLNDESVIVELDSDYLLAMVAEAAYLALRGDDGLQPYREGFANSAKTSAWYHTGQVLDSHSGPAKVWGLDVTESEREAVAATALARYAADLTTAAQSLQTLADAALTA